MASPSPRRLAPGQAGSKVNGAVGLAALAQRIVVVAGGRLDREGCGLCAMSGSKENTPFEALEMSGSKENTPFEALEAPAATHFSHSKR
jgi:hypothetical protein